MLFIIVVVINKKELALLLKAKTFAAKAPPPSVFPVLSGKGQDEARSLQLCVSLLSSLSHS